MEHYEIRKRCISDLSINNQKHALCNCEVLYFNIVRYFREVSGYRLRCHILVKMESCEICFKKFQTIKGLRRHMSTVHSDGRFHCDQCNAVFSRKDNLKRHKQRHCKKNSKASAITSAESEAGLTEE